MATLTVRNLDEEIVRCLLIRAAEHGRSAEAEHREILRASLTGEEPPSARKQAAERLAELRRRMAGRGSAPAVDLLEEAREERTEQLAPKAADA